MFPSVPPIRVSCTALSGFARYQPSRSVASVELVGNDPPSRAILSRPGGTVGNLKLGANATVFLLFFGISVLDAIWSRHWVGAFLWLAFGALFLRADSTKRAA